MQILISWLVSTLAILVTAYILPGVVLAGFVPALVLAVVLGVLNAFIKPVLILLTLPVNILTLGLFTLVINGLIVWMASAVVKGFEVQGFWTAFFFAIVLSIVMFVVESFAK